jgi:hypothetical protein
MALPRRYAMVEGSLLGNLHYLQIKYWLVLLVLVVFLGFVFIYVNFLLVFLILCKQIQILRNLADQQIGAVPELAGTQNMRLFTRW